MYSTKDGYNIKSILEEIDQEFVFTSVLDIKIPKYDSELVHNPLREDKNPTVTFKWIDSANGKKLIMRDWSWANHLDIFDLVQKCIGGVNSVSDAIVYLRQVYIDGISQAQKASIQKARRTIQVKGKKTFNFKSRKFDDEDLAFWEANRIDLPKLQKFNIFGLDKLYIDGSLRYSFNGSNHAYLYKFNRNQDCICYFPKQDRKEGDFPRFRCSSANDIIQGWEQLPATGSHIVITKSLKDVAAAYPDFTAIAPAGENIYISDEKLELLKKRFTYHYVTMDRDRAGYRAALYYRSKGFTPLMFDKDMKKDFTDNYKEMGELEIIDLIEYVKTKYAF